MNNSNNNNLQASPQNNAVEEKGDASNWNSSLPNAGQSAAMTQYHTTTNHNSATYQTINNYYGRSYQNYYVSNENKQQASAAPNRSSQHSGSFLSHLNPNINFRVLHSPPPPLPEHLAADEMKQHYQKRRQKKLALLKLETASNAEVSLQTQSQPEMNISEVLRWVSFGACGGLLVSFLAFQLYRRKSISANY